ncbi:hypothetical protein BJY01DRAFT_111382 [Aspergillus pseudoustus]|uniref:Uncharacterized protein n=1 Tax=Aspergillus pseudoustus TaxID=1810923 RepID=A0ABR4ISJ0_9EURO
MSTEVTRNTALSQLQSEQVKLLDAIDRLAALGVHEKIEVPQVIVWGDNGERKAAFWGFCLESLFQARTADLYHVRRILPYADILARISHPNRNLFKESVHLFMDLSEPFVCSTLFSFSTASHASWPFLASDDICVASHTESQELGPNVYHSINASEPYRIYSFEEIRLGNYQRVTRGY